MADVNYNIDYTASDQATQVTNQLIATLQALDALAAQVKAKLTGYASGGGRSSAAMAKQVEALKQSLAGLQSQLQSTNQTLSVTAGSTQSIATSMAATRAAFMAFHEVEKVLEAIGKGMANAREESERLAAANLKLRDSMRELANLQGHEGPDDQVAGEALLLGMASGLKPDEAVKFLEQFEGSIPAGREKGNIAPGKKDADRQAMEREMAREGAAFGARTGLSPETAGDLAGVVSQYTKINKIEDFAGQLGAMEYGLNAGRGKINPLAKSELGAAGNAIGAGRVKDLAELGAWVGVASTVSKSAGSSGTQFKQVDNLLNSIGGTTGDYLDRIGVSGAKGDLNKLRALRADMQAHGGEDWNKYLSEQGFHNRTDRAATVAMAKNLDVLEQRIAKAREQAATGAVTIALDRDFLGRTGVGAKRQSQAALAASEFVKGQPGESVSIAREFAEARLKAGGFIDTRATNATDALWDATLGGISTKVGGGVDSRRQRINKEMLEAANREAERVGVQGVNPQTFKRLNRQEDVDAAYRDVAGRIKAKDKNADPTGGMKGVEAAVKELVQIEKQKLAQRAAPPVAAPPAPRGKGAAVPGRP